MWFSNLPSDASALVFRLMGDDSSKSIGILLANKEPRPKGSHQAAIDLREKTGGFSYSNRESKPTVSYQAVIELGGKESRIVKIPITSFKPINGTSKSLLDSLKDIDYVVFVPMTPKEEYRFVISDIYIE